MGQRQIDNRISWDEVKYIGSKVYLPGYSRDERMKGFVRSYT